jgi:hypothetical protein
MRVIVNFGETLAYWYFRLNGFFPLPNFVLHRDPQTIEHSSDADILAIRFPFVHEIVGGQEADWDREMFRQWGLDLSTQTIGFIVEVKTGRNSEEYRENIRQSFNLERLIYSVQRLGFYPHEAVREIACQLLNAPIYIDDGRHFVLAKLLVAINFPRDDQIPPSLKLSLDNAENFILSRIAKYRRQKESDRLRFPSDLMQYLMWTQRVRRNQEEDEVVIDAT